MDGEDEKMADINSLLEVNRLDYRLPPSLSVANARSSKHYPANTSTQQMGETVVFQLSSGASYVDFLNSYISMRFTFVSGTAMPQIRLSPHTGWIQAIKRVTLIHSSGVEMDRQNDCVGEWQQILNYYDRSKEQRRTQGNLYNLNDSFFPGHVKWNTTDTYAEVSGADYHLPTNVAAEVPTSWTTFSTGVLQGEAKSIYDQEWRAKYGMQGFDNDAARTAQPWEFSGFREDDNMAGKYVDVVFPLAHIHPFFQQSLLAPSFLCAGMRIEVEFYPKEHFFQIVPTSVLGGTETTVVPVTGTGLWPLDAVVQISQSKIHLESFQLTDSIVRELSRVSARDGLEWNFTGIFNTQLTTAQDANSMSITRALSRANCVVLKTRTVSNVGAAHKDSYASDPWELRGTVTLPTQSQMNSFQVQLGAQHIPALPIDLPKWYQHSANKTFAGFRRTDAAVGVTNAQFNGVNFRAANTVDDTYAGALAIAAVPLETSSTLLQSGSAISAQRTAVVNFAYTSSRNVAADIRRVDLFVPYEKLVTLYLDSVIVRS